MSDFYYPMKSKSDVHFEGTEGFSKSVVYLDPRPPFGTFPKTNPILKIKAFLSHL